MATQPDVWQLNDETSDTTETEKSITHEFIIRNAYTRAEAESKMLAESDNTAPTGMGRRRYNVRRICKNKWHGAVTYGAKWTSLVWQGDFTAETSHITQSLETIAAYWAPGNSGAPNFQGAIGVSGDSLNGADIPTPKFDLTCSISTHYSNVDTFYMSAIAGLTGNVNSAPVNIRLWDFCVLSFAPGELLYKGPTWNMQSTSSYVDVSLSFSASRNETGIQVGNITGIAKRGWDLLWVWVVDAEHNYSLIKRPDAAYVERVCPYGDLSALGVFS